MVSNDGLLRSCYVGVADGETFITRARSEMVTRAGILVRVVSEVSDAGRLAHGNGVSVLRIARRNVAEGHFHRTGSELVC